MAITDDGGNGMVMPVAPMYGGGNGGGFGNEFGGNGWWVLLLFILLGNGAWGNGGYGGGGNGGQLYPWMNQAEITNSGFQNQLLNDNITSIRDGVQGLSTQLCNCCGDMQMAVANGFSQAEIAANGRQMANMNQLFGMQTATMQGFNQVGTGLADLKYTEATEGCATRNSAQQNTRDIIDAINNRAQGIENKLCQLELDGVKGQLAQAQRENVALQNQVNMGAFRESQTTQNGLIMQGFANEVDALYNRLNSCPVPSTPVFGRTPIFTCNNGGCGCNGNGNF